MENQLWLMGGSCSAALNDVWVTGDGIEWSAVTVAAPWSARSGTMQQTISDTILLTWVLLGFGLAAVAGDSWLSAGSNTLNENFNDVWGMKGRLLLSVVCGGLKCLSTFFSYSIGDILSQRGLLLNRSPGHFCLSLCNSASQQRQFLLHLGWAVRYEPIDFAPFIRQNNCGAGLQRQPLLCTLGPSILRYFCFERGGVGVYLGGVSEHGDDPSWSAVNETGACWKRVLGELQFESRFVITFPKIVISACSTVQSVALSFLPSSGTTDIISIVSTDHSRKSVGYGITFTVNGR